MVKFSGARSGSVTLTAYCNSFDDIFSACDPALGISVGISAVTTCLSRISRRMIILRKSHRAKISTDPTTIPRIADALKKEEDRFIIPRAAEVIARRFVLQFLAIALRAGKQIGRLM